MRIKQLELNGFKSFMERTVLELPLGVTAIVGPNGCGKSNIVDAIRWVLGEQSPKHLRGGAMEDVIFAGNTSNGPLGMAEVSLLMERSEEDLLRAATESVEDGGESPESLPPELARVTEVLVTRRYFRSGESEYFINRVPCRLKDITELFLGTGVGTKAYAIIEQGRVEQLVNAKPEDMRLFIEEAAGTTRFRARKVAAERKMERTRENLLRVQDVLRELERQMASLQRQARRAEEYHRIKGELRELDLRVMAARRRQWSVDMQQLGDRLAALQAEEAALQEQLRATEQTSDESRSRRQSKESRLREVEAHVTEERLTAANAASRVQALAARRRDLDARAQEAEREAGHLRARLAGMVAEVAGLAVAVDRLRGEQATAETERSTAETLLRELGAAGAPIEEAVEEAKDTLVGTTAEETRLRNLSDALRRRRDEIAGQRQQLAEEQRVLGERLESNAREREQARERSAAFETERTGVEDAHRRLDAERRTLADDEAVRVETYEATRATLTQLRSRAESLRELHARYEGCTRGVASLLGRDEVGGVLLAGVLRVPATLERAVAAALGARLSHVLLPDTTAALDAIRWLTESGGGSATVVPHDPERRATVIVPPGRRLVDEIEVDTPHWALAEALLGQVLLANDLEDGLRLWRETSQPVTVVTLAGEAIDPLGAMTGGSEPPLEETLLARARELRELDVAIDAAERTAADEAGALADLRARLAAVRQAITVAAERLQALRLEHLATEKDRERLEDERGRIAAELEIGALEASGLAGADGQVAGELVALDDSRQRVTTLLSEHREALARRQEALAAWRTRHAEAEGVRTRAAVAAAEVVERHRAAESELARYRTSITELEERVVVAERSAADASAGAEAAGEEGTAVEGTRASAEARVAVLATERDQLLREVAEADAALSADDLAQRAARERLEGVRRETGELEIALTERRIGLQQVGERLAERYDLGLDALDEVTLDVEGPQEEDALRVEELRARLVRLGDVNPAAMSELEELRGRHEFLVTQRADLENSLDDLKQTIGKLTRTSRQRFEETFTAANAKLAEVFPKVFPSGSAQLEMVAGEEGGEPGIEIVVQLSGKKLQKLSLLSGGEKALTATALVFSLFLIRPTPFCLLDEVDAPLDEANIGRFNALVSEMARQSQFVLITHNRRTMEVAGTLYGITMEQAGVSKVVSVRLSEAA
ncbi:MAG TPA: chromosome segregation protein SMC [Candidatus Binatia bacterium]|jgi:chromosome segregation protein|nr:chromosome segregation protein SMC [Candidatus Binatia bacterium]